ncbi:MAG: GGDEF domain-containing protein, partial [Blautia sp.]|nr:GGDEF domain-containing protein [Blautia sp.]
EGKVGGIVGIDFDAEWYDHQVWMHTVAITIVTVLSVLIGGIVVLLITNRVRAGFSELNQGISSLSANVSELMEEIGAFSEHSTTVETESDLDDIEILNSQIREMQKEMVVYLEHLHTQAYTDSLTGIGNSTAYHERIRELEEAIAQGTAKFSVAVFDVNSLKEINDRFGHESGDRIICGAARSIADAMGQAYTYRIGGDEFAVVKESIDDSEMENMDAGIRTFNREGQEPILAVSKGTASYEPQVDMAFKDVFARADEAMYDDKKAYYETTGNRRKRRT